MRVMCSEGKQPGAFLHGGSNRWTRRNNCKRVGRMESQVFSNVQIDGVQGDSSIRESLQVCTGLKQANFAHGIWKKRKEERNSYSLGCSVNRDGKWGKVQ